MNGYSMEFQNEIAQTGELSAIGLPLRRNVDRSFRRGVEIDVTWQAAKPLQVRHSATYSFNRIRSWTQYYDVYDATGAWAGTTSRTHENVVPLTPRRSHARPGQRQRQARPGQARPPYSGSTTIRLKLYVAELAHLQRFRRLPGDVDLHTAPEAAIHVPPERQADRRQLAGLRDLIWNSIE